MQTQVSLVELGTLKKHSKIATFDNLVLNLDHFVHPGGQALLDTRANTDLTSSFQQTPHSLNAKLMLRGLVIGHLEDTPSQTSLFTQEEVKMVNTYDRVNGKLDLKKPIASQLEDFTREEFLNFVNCPKFLRKDETIQINLNPQDDEPDRTEFWVNIPILCCVDVILFAASMMTCDSLYHVGKFLLCFAVAIFKWTLIEYYFHRVKLHQELDLIETAEPKDFIKLAKSHLIHHAFPNYPTSIVVKLKTILTHLSLLVVIYSLVFSAQTAIFISTGLIFSAIVYDCVHYFIHFGWEPSWQLMVHLKRNHLKHHFKSAAGGFGVTSTLWDWVFGTSHK